MPAYVIDIEADGLLDEVTKIHVLSYTDVRELSPKSITSYEDMLNFLNQDDLTLIGHSLVQYDIPVLRKILGYTGTCRIVDTLGISFYLEASSGRKLHGLEQYGNELGFPKPKVEDWVNLDIETYIHRCEQDVIINYKLWKEVQQPYLIKLYDKDMSEILRLIDYITFKMDCFRRQEELGIPIDPILLSSELVRLRELSDEKFNILKEAMPKVPIKGKKVKPKVMHTQDGELTHYGKLWVQFLKDRDLPEDTEGPVEYITGYDEPNPRSMTQIKSWLYNIGWEPIHIKHQRDKKTNTFRQIPQISSEYDKTEICQSVKDLVDKEPALEHLAGFTTINSRISVLEGFLENHKDLKLYQGIGKFTNTMRVSHRVLVNIPKPGAPFAENIRGILVCDDGDLMCGADLSGIEDATKQHYIYPYDPDYVNEMRSDDWDPHVNIAVISGLMTKEDEVFFKTYVKGTSEGGDARYAELKDKRQSAKTVNFSSTYKVGKKTLARNLKSTEEFAQKLLDGFWNRNKAILQVEASIERKTVNGQMWVKQPVSGFWYSLRTEKDIFSTVNQSTAVFCFDTWVKHIISLGGNIYYQSHDEHLSIVKEGDKEKYSNILKEAMRLTNEELKLNVPIQYSEDWGKSYLEVH